VRGVLDATNSSDRTDDDRERWQRFQRHVFCVLSVCLPRVFCPTIFLKNRKKKKKKKKKDERLFVLLSE
jgi:hypothetical protein